jgi:hypothetical protein
LPAQLAGEQHDVAGPQARAELLACAGGLFFTGGQDFTREHLQDAGRELLGWGRLPPRRQLQDGIPKPRGYVRGDERDFAFVCFGEITGGAVKVDGGLQAASASSCANQAAASGQEIAGSSGTMPALPVRFTNVRPSG